MDLNTLVNCPMCAAVVVLVGLFAPKLAPFLGPILSRLAKRTKPSTPPTPTPDDTAPKLPLLDRLLKRFQADAVRRFPHLSEAEAMDRLDVEGRFYAHLAEEEARKKKASTPG